MVDKRFKDPDRPHDFLSEVALERSHQQQRWGDDHDVQKWDAEWAMLILRYAGRIAEDLEETHGLEDDTYEALRQLVEPDLVKLGAICMALYDRIERRRSDAQARILPVVIRPHVPNGIIIAMPKGEDLRSRLTEEEFGVFQAVLGGAYNMEVEADQRVAANVLEKAGIRVMQFGVDGA